ncbi:MAG: TolC family protein [Bacteroidia bacterium]|nr:TolC family protein [Bacteroidia bacterium]
MNIKTVKKYALGLSMILSVFKAQSQNAGSVNYSLKQAIDYAFKNSPNYLNAELEIQNSKYRKKEVLGVGLPQINSSVDLKDYIDIPTSLLPGQFFGAPAGTFIPVKFGTKYNATAGFSASQLIFSSDYIVGVKAAKELINLSTINVNRSKTELVSSVSKAYYNVVVNKERTKLLDANIIKLKKIFDDTKAFNQQGFVEQIDLERLEVQYNNLVVEKEKTDRLIGLSESLLKFQMGYKISEPIVLTDSLTFENNDVASLLSGKIDISKRADYQLLQSQQRLYQLDLKRQRLGYLPTVAAYGSYQYNAQRQKFDFTDGSQSWFKISLIGGTVNLNIFDGLQRHNRIQQAKIAVQKGENNLKNIELAAEIEATISEVTYQNAYASLQTQKRNMQLAQHVFDVSQKKYEQGVGSNLEITNAQTALKEAQTNYYNAVYDMIVSKIDFQKATGTLVK